MKPKSLFVNFSPNPSLEVVSYRPMCLGSLIREQMYHGVNPSQSTLVTGEYDAEESWDVDPACDMNTDRFGTVVETVPQVSPAGGSDTPPDVE